MTNSSQQTPQRKLVQQILQLLQRQVPDLPANTRIDLVPQTAFDSGHPGLVGQVVGDAQRPWAVGGKSANRTPVVRLLNDLGYSGTADATRHELGHILEPYLVRNPNRAKKLIQLLGLKPQNDVQQVKYDQWGLPFSTPYVDPGGVQVSPIEYYADVVSRQLGRPSYSDLTPSQQKATMGQPGFGYGYPPSLPHPLVHQLVQSGLIPKHVTLNDIQLGS